jgi:acyl-CoA reductase-like NAD-dependent aldehyde dehydrogenase
MGRAAGTATMPIMDPSMDEQVGTVALGSLPDVDRAVRAAARRSKSSGDGRRPTASRSSNASARAPRRGMKTSRRR